MFVLHRIIVQCASSASSGLFVLHRMIALFRRTRRSTSCSVQVRLVQRLVQLFRGTRRSAIRRTAHCDALCGVSKGSVPASVLPAKRRGPPRAPRPAARNAALFGRVGPAEPFRPPPPPSPLCGARAGGDGGTGCLESARQPGAPMPPVAAVAQSAFGARSDAHTSAVSISNKGRYSANGIGCEHVRRPLGGRLALGS